MKKIYLSLISTTIVIVLLTQLTAAQPILTGIFYDPQGTDTGFEWVELYNPVNETVNLSDYQILKGNGAVANDWTNIPALSGIIAPFSFFLIGESNVSTADFITKLALFNGPDSVSLLSIADNETVDVVGYGPMTYSGYFEGSPTKDVASGKALARKFTIDEQNNYLFSQTQNNSADWDSADPHPRNRLFVYHAPVADNATVSLIVPQSPLIIQNYSFTDDMPVQSGIQWALVSKKAISFDIEDDAGSLDDESLQIYYTLGQGLVAKNVVSSGATKTRFGNIVSLSDAITLPSDLTPGNYTLTVYLQTNSSSENSGVATTPRSFSQSWQVDILPTLGFNLCASLTLAKSQDGSYQGTCTCSNAGNVPTLASFGLQFSQDVVSKIFIRINNSLLPVNQTTIMFAPGETQTLSFIANVTNWLHFGTYNGLLTVNAWTQEN